MISTRDSDDFTNIPSKAIKLYAQLSEAFNKFLKTELTWGVHKEEIPLYKIILQTYNQLPDIDLARFDYPHLEDICQFLVRRSEQVDQRIDRVYRRRMSMMKLRNLIRATLLVLLCSCRHYSLVEAPDIPEMNLIGS